MAKKFNYSLIGLFGILGLSLGASSQDLSVAFTGADFLFLLVGMILSPSILVVYNDVFPLTNDLRAPDLDRWSFNPWQPLRFLYFFACLSLSIGITGSVSVLATKGIGSNLSFPAAFLVSGFGLFIGSAIATRVFQNRLVPEEN